MVGFLSFGALLCDWRKLHDLIVTIIMSLLNITVLFVVGMTHSCVTTVFKLLKLHNVACNVACC